VVAEIESLPSVKRAVEAGLGSTILPLGAVADEVAAGRLRASTIESAAMSRRVVYATSVTRPGTAGGVAVARVVGHVLRRMVEDGSWPARWVGK
jgi:LysR family transcriptional regulator, nitrogen assimilation regulatory protein